MTTTIKTRKQFHDGLGTGVTAAASVISTDPILVFVALVQDAIAGWLGGASDVVRPVYADRAIPLRRVV